MLIFISVVAINCRVIIFSANQAITSSLTASFSFLRALCHHRKSQTKKVCKASFWFHFEQKYFSAVNIDKVNLKWSYNISKIGSYNLVRLIILVTIYFIYLRLKIRINKKSPHSIWVIDNKSSFTSYVYVRLRFLFFFFSYKHPLISSHWVIFRKNIFITYWTLLNSSLMLLHNFSLP